MTEFIQLAPTLLAFASAAVAIIASYRAERPLLFYVTKPLTTALITLPVLALLLDSGGVYVALIGAGLVLALVGDVALMLPEDHFVLGIVSFALTHVLYLAAFVLLAGPAVVNPISLFFVLYAILMARYVWPGVKPSLRVPVLLYVVLITAMASQAVGGALAVQATALTMASVGALLFLASDSLLAINRFRRTFTAAQALILSTYWGGQWLISLSALQIGSSAK